MKNLLLGALALIVSCLPATAQDGSIQSVLQVHRAEIERSSRTTIEPAIAAILASDLPQARLVLFSWADKAMWQRKSEGLFYLGDEVSPGTYRLTDFDSGATIGEFPNSELDQLKPNSGIRALIATALVQFQLTDDSLAKRRDALASIERDPDPGHLEPLRAVLHTEPDPALKARLQRAERLLTIAYDPGSDARVAAISSTAGGLGVDLRAVLNPLVATRRKVAEGAVPEGENLARVLVPGKDIELADAYAMLVAEGAPIPLTPALMREVLAAHVASGRVGGVPVAHLDTDAARQRAYAALVAGGLAPAAVAEADITALVARHAFYDAYVEQDVAVTNAATAALERINFNVGLNQGLDLALDALSLASIYFLAAIGLAITFGVMGVINMAHGEFIMMGAYTGYVVQQFVPDHTQSILLAIPLAFAVTFAAGVAMERLVIRWLYNRPLETLLATFGISIALQQLAKNIFGTQARPLTAPAWLDGSLVVNDVVAISYIRIAIFGLALIFLGVYLYIIKRTRLGLETRAVTQNPRMAASMGINPNRVSMLTFGLGSGIAGIAGVAIGLFAKVTSELGTDYIVPSFMTVVVGGVGNIFGTLAGAAMIGFLQKGIEWFNPSNTLAAQTYMIVFIILFIQFRPRGIVALKGRAAGD